MKKIFLAVLFLVSMMFVPVMADEIIDSRGTVIPCKFESIEEGLIKYYQDGVLHTLVRVNDSPIFNDYIDVRINLFKPSHISRIPGKIIAKDMWSVIINNGSENVDIPFYKIKAIGVYKP